MMHEELNQTNSLIKFKTTILKSSLCDYSDAYVLVTATITVAANTPNRNNKEVIFKNCAPFTDCKSEIKNLESVFGRSNWSKFSRS